MQLCADFSLAGAEARAHPPKSAEADIEGAQAPAIGHKSPTQEHGIQEYVLESGG